MAVSLEFILKPEDFAESFRVYQQSRPVLRYMNNFSFYTLIFVFAFLVGFKIYGWIINDLEIVRKVGQFILIFSGFLLLCNPIFGNKAMAFFMWKVAPFLKEPVLVEIEESRFTYQNAVMRSEVEWSSIQRVIESKHIFLVLHQLKASYTLPKRSFTEENLREFKQILDSNHIVLEQR